MKKIIHNKWQQIEKGQFHAAILNRAIHPEGLDISRFSFKQAGETELSSSDGHIVTILSGQVQLKINSYKKSLKLGSFVHLYIPPEENAQLRASENTQLVHVAGPKEQARGKKLLVRDEQFLRATADQNRLFRWILTPQYLSRRVFLYNDLALLSKTHMPVSWFRTTMFDVKGLPVNDDGLSVFKMSYDNQTEPNICYDVSGEAKVRMACHPYSDNGQKWSEWQLLDNNTTYYLNEDAHGSDVEWHTNPETGEQFSRRNKHEVYIPEGGYVSLCCLFDPAPTGTEKHLPGKYSSYEHVSKIVGTEVYQQHLKALKPYDDMVDKLSIQKAQALLEENNKNPLWTLYQQGLKNQINLESQLVRQLQEEKQGRDTVVLKWINRR
jgi:quercetin dioxygenase-like cupin family protein